MVLTNNVTFVSKHCQSVADLMTETFGKSKQDADKTIAVTDISQLSIFKNTELLGFMVIAIEELKSRNVGIFDGICAILVVSQTFDMQLPSTSTRIQALLNLPTQTFCMDINDGCCGFIKATKVAKMLIDAGYDKVLVIAGDINSAITKNSDFSTKILFGDGFTFSTFEKSSDAFLSEIHNNGLNADYISCQANTFDLKMNGFEVFRFTKNSVPTLVRSFLSRLEFVDFDLVGYHQASGLIVNSLSSSLGITTKYGKSFNCSKIGNLGSGSIGAWLANVSEIPFNKKMKMLAIGYGAGLSWGVSSIYVDIKEVNEVLSVDY